MDAAKNPATDVPPVGVNVLAYDKGLEAWWQASYIPDEDVNGYQPKAWLFVGLDGLDPEVSRWCPMPPLKPR